MQWKLITLLVVFFCAANIQDARAQNSFDSLLKEADAARSSDPKRFTELLEQLRNDKQKTTLLQKQRLKYLQAYEAAIYRDQLSQGSKLAQQLFDETKDPNLKYRAGGLVASFSALTRDFTTGLRYLQKAQAIRKEVADKAIHDEGLAAGALLYSEIGQHRIALRYAQQMLDGDPAPRIECFAGNFKVLSQFELGLLPKDSAPIEAVITRCSQLKEYIPANVARGILARKLASDGKPEKAIELLEATLPEVQATRYPRLIAGLHALLADLKLKLGDVPAAEAHARMTIALGEQIKSSSTLVSAYNTLYQIAATREKPSVALELYKRYAESEMAHHNDVKAKELAYEIFRHQTKQQAQQLALERASTQKARLVAGFLLVMLGAIVFWMINIKRHQGQLQRLAQTDALTGLGNRHFFTQKSERALVEAARAGDSAALVMFDLDHFKAINDTYGHGAGDWVLKQVGKTCSAHCRKIDYIGRIGGEEFAVLLHGFDLASAARMAEDCRSQLAQIDTRECGYSFVVTASFGVSSTALSGYDLSRLLSHADQMLYRAKNEGRNRVCAYTAEAAVDHKSPKRSPTLTVINN
jgi:diguanylate cyclase